MFLRAAFAALLIAVPLFAEEAAVSSLIGQLGADDAATRDDAEGKLRAAGESVLAPLRKALESKAAEDPETRGRISGLIAGIEKDVQSRAARAVLDRHLKGRKCDQCGRERVWGVTEIHDPLLERILPKVSVFQMSWSCCGIWDGPTPVLLSVVCRDPDAVFDIADRTDVRRLAKWLPPVKSAEDAQDVGNALMGLAGICHMGSSNEYFPGAGTVEEDSARGIVYHGSAGNIDLRFGADGSLLEERAVTK